MGPGGGPDGARIVAQGLPQDVARDPGSVTGPWLAKTWACRTPSVSITRALPRADRRITVALPGPIQPPHSRN